ncbi:hypothetical protein [Amycolatopsis pigmentata]|uniref:Uncharacterized protein n=1 Tax=Amycolatopsis pigmentata TaxID=450801 RepID=A0ABW5G2J8_9PSEU
MTRTQGAPGGWRSWLGSPSPDDAERQPASALSSALVLGAVAAVLLAMGGLVPVVAGASPGFSSVPLLIVLALAPLAVVVVFLSRGRTKAAAGVLAGVAALVPGRLAIDLEFLIDPSATSRPELYRPVVFALPSPAAGIWLLLAGLVATAAAGGFAVGVARSRPESRDGSRVRMVTGLLGAVVAAMGVMMAPFSSDDAFLPVGSAFERPPAVLAGCLLLAFALPVAAALSSTSAAETARGGLLGLAVGTATVALPNLVAASAVSGLGLAPGPVFVLVGTVGLVIAACLPGVRKGGFAAEPMEAGSDAGVASLPGSSRLRVATGVLGLATMLTAFVGALAPQVEVVGGIPGPQSPSRWLLFAAGLLVGVPAAAMFVPRLAANVRPVLSAGWAGVVLAATAVLTTAITASELGAGLGPGPGVPWTAVAIVCAAATACCSVVAGMVERDDAEEATDQVPGPNLLTPLFAGGILAIGAFGTPAIVGTDYTEPALWPNFGTPSWGLLIALLTVAGACLLAPRCRPARAAALLAGAAGVALLRVVALPLTAGLIPGAHAGVGWWLAIGCAVALVLAAVIAVTGKPGRGAK